MLLCVSLEGVSRLGMVLLLLVEGGMAHGKSCLQSLPLLMLLQLNSPLEILVRLVVFLLLYCSLLRLMALPLLMLLL